MLFIVSFLFLINFHQCHTLLLLELAGIGFPDKPIMHPMTNKFQNVCRLFEYFGAKTLSCLQTVCAPCGYGLDGLPKTPT